MQQHQNTSDSNLTHKNRLTMTQRLSLKKTKMSFPMKLHALLEDAENEANDFSHVVSWLPGGKAFKIHKPEEFCDGLMEEYFQKKSKFKSFTRQVSDYNTRSR